MPVCAGGALTHIKRSSFPELSSMASYLGGMYGLRTGGMYCSIFSAFVMMVLNDGISYVLHVCIVGVVDVCDVSVDRPADVTIVDGRMDAKNRHLGWYRGSGLHRCGGHTLSKIHVCCSILSNGSAPVCVVVPEYSSCSVSMYGAMLFL